MFLDGDNVLKQKSKGLPKRALFAL